MASPLKREISPTVVAVVIVVVIALVVAVYWFTLGSGPKTEPMPRPPEGVTAPSGVTPEQPLAPR